MHVKSATPKPLPSTPDQRSCVILFPRNQIDHDGMADSSYRHKVMKASEPQGEDHKAALIKYWMEKARESMEGAKSEYVLI